MRKKPKSRQLVDCEHLNAYSTSVEGQEIAMCRDCNQAVDAKHFEPEKQPTDDLLPFIRSGKKIIKVTSFEATNLCKLGNLKPFLPVFDLQPGDFCVIYRAEK